MMISESLTNSTLLKARRSLHTGQGEVAHDQGYQEHHGKQRPPRDLASEAAGLGQARPPFLLVRRSLSGRPSKYAQHTARPTPDGCRPLRGQSLTQAPWPRDDSICSRRCSVSASCSSSSRTRATGGLRETAGSPVPLSAVPARW